MESRGYSAGHLLAAALVGAAVVIVLLYGWRALLAAIALPLLFAAAGGVLWLGWVAVAAVVTIIGGAGWAVWQGGVWLVRRLRRAT